ncbi:MAG: flagellar basal body P-ring formation protein FlgA [bacterium]|nr:flagellar basal body P-ring formation protein FlgA [bacterium]
MIRRLLCTLSIAIWALPLPAAAAGMQRLDGSRVAALAARVARQTAGAPDRELDAVASVPDMEIPSGTVSLASGPRPRPTATYVSIPVVVSVNGQAVRTVYVGYRITTYLQVPVAARNLAAGSVLKADDLEMKRLPAMGRIPASADELLGRRTLASVPAGTPVFPEMTAAVPLVRAGQPCLLVVTDDGVRVTAEAISRQDGVLGQTVAVYVEQTKRAVSAIVSGKGRVEFDLDPSGGQDVASGS